MGSATASSGDGAGVVDVGDDGLGAGEVRRWCIGRTPVTAVAALPSTAGPAAGRAWGPHDARGCRRGDSRACEVCLGIAASSTSHLWPERAGPRGVVVCDARYRRTIQRAGVGDRRRQRRRQPLFAPLHAPDRGNIADSAHRIPPSELNNVILVCFLLSRKIGNKNPFLKLDCTAHIKCAHHLLKLVWDCDMLSSGHLYPKTANATWTHKHRDHILIATCNRDSSKFQLSGHSDIRPRTRST